jgi:hypothetical protein
MTEPLPELSTVRIVRMNRPPTDYVDATGFRPPAVGETGVIVMVCESTTGYGYIVESVRPDGRTEWLATFDADEVRQCDDAD